MHLTAGIGLKPVHFEAALACVDAGLWLEVHPENYVVDGGPRLAWLALLRERHALSLHGVGMSLASPDAPEPAHLERLAMLADRFEPALQGQCHAVCAVGGDHPAPVGRGVVDAPVQRQRLAGAVAALRARVVPQGPTQEEDETTEAVSGTHGEAGTAHGWPHCIRWAWLLKRVFDIDKRHRQNCPNCGAGPLELIAAILERPAIDKIITHLGLQARAPPRAATRAHMQQAA